MSKNSSTHAAVPGEGARILPFSTDPGARQPDVIVSLDAEDPADDLEYLPPVPERDRTALKRIASHVAVGLLFFGGGFVTRQMTAPAAHAVLTAPASHAAPAAPPVAAAPVPAAPAAAP